MVDSITLKNNAMVSMSKTNAAPIRVEATKSSPPKPVMTTLELLAKNTSVALSTRKDVPPITMYEVMKRWEKEPFPKPMIIRILKDVVAEQSYVMEQARKQAQESQEYKALETAVSEEIINTSQAVNQAFDEQVISVENGKPVLNSEKIEQFEGTPKALGTIESRVSKVAMEISSQAGFEVTEVSAYSPSGEASTKVQVPTSNIGFEV